MKQSGAESRGRETRTLERWRMSARHGSKAAGLLLCHSRALPLLPVVRMWGKTALFYHTRHIWVCWKLCHNAALCVCHMSNEMHNILKCLWGFHVFYKIKPEIEGVWRHWQATQGHDSCHKLKLLISLDLYLLWNIWDNVSTQFSKIYNTVLVFFGYFNQSLTYCAFNLTLLI